LSGTQHHLQSGAVRRRHFGRHQIRQHASQHFTRSLCIGAWCQGHAHTVRLNAVFGDLLHVRERHVRLRERAAQILFIDLEQLIDGTIDIHLVKQIQTTAQIETKGHGSQAEVAQPVGRARSERECRDIFLGELLVDQIASLELLWNFVEVQHQSTVVDVAARYRHSAPA